ncbi:MAG TPA: methylated-DNA--[protein]-cysteine S-methyltransferase [Isosphaeraceae bacterium]|jgi:AraC family transcriptional regulator of adaptative response/methylated-DNA-[protein]-cysteine methyltransferase|nr:methylated-DNA--[protein]-cysteine S-methyltransferase [Isosphaeraceae bacterium]
MARSMHSACEPAVLSHPVFERSAPVVGVRTTRIYCRPSCRPARSPKPENCIPFANAAAARAAGFRACKLCKPDEPVEPARLRREPEPVHYAVGSTQLGPVFFAWGGAGLRALYLLETADPKSGLERLAAESAGAALIAGGGKELNQYVARVNAFLASGGHCVSMKLDLQGTPFQKNVWTVLQSVGPGQTCTYADLARQVGLPESAARAIASACAANPIALFVPCHRVVRSDGGAGGYRWGVGRKLALLEAEKRAMLRSAPKSDAPF